MARIVNLTLLLALITSLPTGSIAQPLTHGVAPLNPERLPLPAASGTEGTFTLQRVLGHLNVVGTEDESRDGIGVFDIPEELPQDNIILTTQLVVNPLPYAELTPRGATLGPDGLFYFVGSVNESVGDLALYSLDPEDPSAGYTLVSDAVEDGLLAAGVEFPVGLGYNADTGEAALVTHLCAEVEGVYYQSFLYEFDIATGTVGGRLELRDPAAPSAEDDGVCLFSASWEEGVAVFGADTGGDIVEMDAESGLLVERYPAVTLPNETVERVQSATFDAEEGEHLVFPFSLERDGQGEVVAAYTRAFSCTSAGGCDFRGFVAEESDGLFFTVEVLTAAVLPKPPVAVETGTPLGGPVVEIYPNPFSSRASVALRLGMPEAVTVTVHDLLGRTVALLYEGQISRLDLTLEGSNFPSGVYIVRAQGETFSAVRKVVVAR